MQAHELLFELSNPVRYEIIKFLAEEPARLTRIGEYLHVNNPEVSRHLDRLKNAKLVEKAPEGRYHLSPLGEVVLSIVPTVTLVAHNDSYFNDHDLSSLPLSFLTRLGELSIHDLHEGVLRNIQNSGDVIKGAQKHLSIITKEVGTEAHCFIREGMSEGVNVRVLIDDGFETPSCCLEPEFQNTIRFIPRNPVALILSEQHAVLMFPNRNGKFDFTAGYTSEDPTFLKWCTDLFTELWEKGEHLTSLSQTAGNVKGCQ